MFYYFSSQVCIILPSVKLNMFYYFRSQVSYFLLSSWICFTTFKVKYDTSFRKLNMFYYLRSVYYFFLSSWISFTTSDAKYNTSFCQVECVLLLTYVHTYYTVVWLLTPLTDWLTDMRVHREVTLINYRLTPQKLVALQACLFHTTLQWIGFLTLTMFWRHYRPIYNYWIKRQFR